MGKKIILNWNEKYANVLPKCTQTENENYGKTIFVIQYSNTL